jgi:hypothetical protein
MIKIYNMRLKSIIVIINALLFGLQAQFSFSQFDVLKKQVQTKVEEKIIGDNDSRTAKLIAKFEESKPISTTFDDAIYEADFLSDYEPEDNAYRPLDLQPRAERGGYILHSGLYTMSARSFCLRSSTHGPSRGDGHLYAPMKGKKSGFVQSIIEQYAAKPEIPQQDVQVLLWAIIAGADMDELGERYAKTLTSLFTTDELLVLTAKGWAEGYAQKQFDELRGMIVGKTPEKLQALLDADHNVRTLIKNNKSFREIEEVAILAGIAPRDMIREVSKGRWYYHPDGFFIRFFQVGIHKQESMFLCPTKMLSKRML